MGTRQEVPEHPHSDIVPRWTIALLRGYVMHSPFPWGKWRMVSKVHECADRLHATSLDIRSVDGRRFRIDPRERQYRMGVLGTGHFEANETKVVREHVRRGDVVVDAGANFGWFTTLMSKLVGDGGQVHAFEPVPKTREILTVNCRLNRCGNVRILEEAFGEDGGTATIYWSPERASGDATMYPEARSGQATACPTTTLDGYLERHGVERCDFIKCDIEGAEKSFLEGAGRTLAVLRPTLLIEINATLLQRAGTSPREVLDLIRGHDYAIRVVDSPAPAAPPPGYWETFDGYVDVLATPREK